VGSRGFRLLPDDQPLSCVFTTPKGNLSRVIVFDGSQTLLRADKKDLKVHSHIFGANIVAYKSAAVLRRSNARGIETRGRPAGARVTEKNASDHARAPGDREESGGKSSREE
jgi:hypothetical protein